MHRILCATLALLSSLSLAKDIPMYTSPKDAKPSATLKVNQTLTIVHYPWIQVYDPISKHTGWVKEKDLAQQLNQPIKVERTFVQNGNHSVQMIEYHSSNQRVNPEAIAKIIAQNQRLQQQVIQEMSDSFRSMEAMNQLIWKQPQPKLSIKIIDTPPLKSIQH